MAKNINKVLLQYPKCGTCKKAIKWLKDNNIKVNIRDIVEANPTKKELESWIKMSKKPITKFFNTSGMLYRSMNVKEKINILSHDELVDLLSYNGMLVKRPILISESFIVIGFNEDEWNNEIKK